MKAIFYFIIIAIMIISELIPFRSEVTGDDIVQNMRHLKKHQWFKDYLNDETYQSLIVSNKIVRKTIGKFNTNKLSKEGYLAKCEKKLYRVLNKESKNVKFQS